MIKELILSFGQSFEDFQLGVYLVYHIVVLTSTIHLQSTS